VNNNMRMAHIHLGRVPGRTRVPSLLRAVRRSCRRADWYTTQRAHHPTLPALRCAASPEYKGVLGFRCRRVHACSA